jgi:hypothetical protein
MLFGESARNFNFPYIIRKTSYSVLVRLLAYMHLFRLMVLEKINPIVGKTTWFIPMHVISHDSPRGPFTLTAQFPNRMLLKGV